MKVFKHGTGEEIMVLRKPKRREWRYRCQFCRALDEGIVHYTSRSYGTGNLLDLSGDWDGGDSNYDEQIDIDEYECNACGETRSSIDDLFTDEEEEEEEEDEDL